MDASLFFFRLSRYLRHTWTAKGKHGIHSPFLFSLYNEVIADKEEKNEYYFAERYREELLKSESNINRTDAGAGNDKSGNIEKPLREEVENSGISEKTGRLLFRLIRHFNPCNIIELGTNAGISMLYMALGTRKEQKYNFYTIEECADLHQQAVTGYGQRRSFYFGLPEVNFLKGTFVEHLPKILKEIPRVDFAFIDGDHRKAATLNNFDLLLQKAGPDTIMVFDDIYWSPEMEEAWKTIIANPRVTLSLDMYNVGIVFTNPSFSKESFRIKW